MLLLWEEGRVSMNARNSCWVLMGVVSNVAEWIGVRGGGLGGRDGKGAEDFIRIIDLLR